MLVFVVQQPGGTFHLLRLDRDIDQMLDGLSGDGAGEGLDSCDVAIPHTILDQRLVHHLDKAREQVVRILRAGRGFGMVLHREGGHLGGSDALDDPVVQVHVGDLSGAKRAFGHGEVVVLAGDLHHAVSQAPHGVVAAVVAEGELGDRATERGGEELVAEADACLL